MARQTSCNKKKINVYVKVLYKHALFSYLEGKIVYLGKKIQPFEF